MIIPKNYFFQNIKIKLNSNAWMTLKSSVVIFQALKPLQPQWPQWPQQPQWPQWPQQPHFIKNFTDPHVLIIPSTQMTNTCPFLWHGSSKIPFLTNIWYSFCRRLLRPADVIFLKTDWWNTNVQSSWTRYAPLSDKIIDPSTPQSHLESYVFKWDTLYYRLLIFNLKSWFSLASTF